MSRYTCYECKAEHGTDNMVAVCVQCFARLKAEVEAAKQSKRIVATVDSIAGPETASLVESVLIAVDRAEAAERRCTEMERAVEARVWMEAADMVACSWGRNTKPQRFDCKCFGCAFAREAVSKSAALTPAPQIAGEAKPSEPGWERCGIHDIYGYRCSRERGHTGFCNYIPPNAQPAPAPSAADGRSAHCRECWGSGVIEWTAGGETKVDPCPKCKPAASGEAGA